MIIDLKQILQYTLLKTYLETNMGKNMLLKVKELVIFYLAYILKKEDGKLNI